MRNKITTPPLTISVFPGSASLLSFPPPLHSPSVTWEWGLGSVYNSSLLFLPILILSLFDIGFCLQETNIHQHGFFPRAAVLQEVLQHGSFLDGPVLWEWTAPVWWVPCGPQVLPEWSLSRIFRNSPGKGVGMMCSSVSLLLVGKSCLEGQISCI